MKIKYILHNTNIYKGVILSINTMETQNKNTEQENKEGTNKRYSIVFNNNGKREFLKGTYCSRRRTENKVNKLNNAYGCYKYRTILLK